MLILMMIASVVLVTESRTTCHTFIRRILILVRGIDLYHTKLGIVVSITTSSMILSVLVPACVTNKPPAIVALGAQIDPFERGSRIGQLFPRRYSEYFTLES